MNYCVKHQKKYRVYCIECYTENMLSNPRFIIRGGN